MFSSPWFRSLNYELLRLLFTCIHHTPSRVDIAQEFIFNPLLSTWIFGCFFYLFWTKEDDQKLFRRYYLAISVIALAIASLITLLLRPIVYWPAPSVDRDFQRLFPGYLWGTGVSNCFPSHSTLAYFTIAAGFWPLNRRISISLSAVTLLFISLPRVYEGGHYPIDVVFSCLLATAVLYALWCGLSPLRSRLTNPKLLGGHHLDSIFFLFVFELAEGFRGTQLLVMTAWHALFHR